MGALPAMAALKTFRKKQTQKRIFTTMYFQRFPDYSKKPERQYITFSRAYLVTILKALISSDILIIKV